MNYNGEEQFRPISGWGYVGYTFLYSIPVVGIIFLVLNAFSNKNINRRNYARSYFYMFIIAFVAIFALGFLSGLAGAQ